MASASASGGDEAWIAPEAERARANPIAPTPEALARGRALYLNLCALCHGDLGRGDGPAAPFGKRPPRDLSEVALQDRLTDGEVFWKVTEGRREASTVLMPGFGEKLPVEADRWKLVLFVRTLRAR